MFELSFSTVKVKFKFMCAVNKTDLSHTQDPLQLSKEWLKEAEQSSQITHPNAMAVATVNPKGQPSSRIVLLKEINNEGFIFSTNYESQKGRDLEQSPLIAANIYWDPLFRQICIQGAAEKLDRQDSQKYWASRPRESQISHFVSPQSQPVESRAFLDQQYNKALKQFRNDLFLFLKSKSSWLAQRLFP